MKVDAYSTGPRITLSKVREDEDCFIGERFALWAIIQMLCPIFFFGTETFTEDPWVGSWSISIQILCFGCYPSLQRLKTATIFALKKLQKIINTI